MKEEAKELNLNEMESISGGEKTTVPPIWEYCSVCEQQRRFLREKNPIYYDCEICGHKIRYVDVYKK